jgi:hypothetical protein
MGCLPHGWLLAFALPAAEQSAQEIGLGVNMPYLPTHGPACCCRG